MMRRTIARKVTTNLIPRTLILSSFNESCVKFLSTRAVAVSEHLPGLEDASTLTSTSKRQHRKTQELPIRKSNPSEVTAPPLISPSLQKQSLPPSPSSVTYTGSTTMPITSKLRIYTKEELPTGGTWPVFRLMDENGKFRDSSCDGYETIGTTAPSTTPPSTKASGSPPSNEEPRHNLDILRSNLEQEYTHDANMQSELSRNALLHYNIREYSDTNSTNTLHRAFIHMTRLRQMDKILQSAQRQGRISFYMTCRGEEAIHIGTAVSLTDQDTIFAQYREAGLLMWRGFTLTQFTDQCFSNSSDLGRGRQMPIHYGSRALNYHTISSPLGTQLPHAVGAAYRLKLHSPQNAVSVCMFGDGCASTTDFHSALNFAATLEAPVIFLCRNNGYAISTPVTDQYAGDGIVSRAYGYGMAGLRVDGNDIFAMTAAIREARAYALREQKPILVEAMTYRQGHHSTSDDSTRYRDPQEVQQVSVHADPVNRLKHFLSSSTDTSANDDVDNNTSFLTRNEIASIRDEEKMAVLKCMQAAETKSKPDVKYLFEDVYHHMPSHLIEQQEQLQQHMEKYPDRYK